MAGGGRKTRTIGISPKVLAATVTSVATFLITKLGLSWDPIYEQAINAVAPLVAAYLAPPADTRVA
jgi:hypothetical protein